MSPPYQDYLEHFDAIAYRTTLASFTPTFFAGAVEPITGYSPAELTQGTLCWLDLVHPDDRAKVLAATVRPYAVGDVLRQRYRIVRRDGGLRWVDDVARVVRGGKDAEPFLHGTVHDVTERVAADAALTLSHRVLVASRKLQERFILEGEATLRIDDMLAILRETTESEVSLLLEAAEGAHGKTRFRLRGTPAPAPTAADLSLTPGDESPRHHPASPTADAPASPTIPSSAGPDVGFAPPPADPALLDVGDSVLQPILQRRVPVVLRAPSPRALGELAFWLPPLQNLLGLPLVVGGELVGILVLGNGTAGYGDDLPRLLEPLCSTCAALLVALRAEQERRRAERERRRLEASILQAQKLESIGLLAGGIAHDFNNLLTAILGNASLARLHTPPMADASHFLEEIEAAARRAAELCRQLLAYAGKGAFAVEPMQLSGAVREAAHRLHAGLSKNASLVLELDDGLPVIEADPTQLHQLLVNVLSNASDALGDGRGNVRVRTSFAPLSEPLTGAVGAADPLSPGDYVLLEVEDTGCGMSASVLARIFEPFFSTKFPGRGLGLAATLGIVRQLRGGIFVTSTEGRGTTFRIYIPCARLELEGEASTKPSSGERPSRGRRTILVVDDEASIRGVAKRALERAGFFVLTASDGAEALDVLRRDGPVMLVLADLTMPRLGGKELLHELAKASHPVPVLLMSGYTEGDVLREGELREGELREGDLQERDLQERDLQERKTTGVCVGFLQKPFTADDLVERIRSLEQAPALSVA